MQQVLTVGCIGLLGLLFGIQLASLGRGSSSVFSRTEWLTAGRTQRLTPFALMASIALILSTLVTPETTILQAAYTSGNTVGKSMNFGAANVLAYVFLLILYIDTQREEDLPTRRVKRFLLSCAVLYSVLFLQLLRGDREAAGLVLSLIVLSINLEAFSVRFSRIHRKTYARAVAAILFIGFIFITVGSIRGGSLVRTDHSVDFIDGFIAGWKHSTWNAVLWTNVSLLVLFDDSGEKLKFGKTYLDYGISLVPGVVAKLINFERPVDSDSREAVELSRGGLTGGGMHVVNIPYWNFGVAGAFVILAAWGYFIAVFERMSLSRALLDRILWAATIMSMFRWFWYGDMALIRGLMAAVLVWVTYVILLHIAPRYRRHIAWN